MKNKFELNEDYELTEMTLTMFGNTYNPKQYAELIIENQLAHIKNGKYPLSAKILDLSFSVLNDHMNWFTEDYLAGYWIAVGVEIENIINERKL